MVAELTRAYRRRLGITQEELAERTGLSARAIRAIETGRSGSPRPATVRLLAEAFGLSGPERDRYYESAMAAPRQAARTVPPAVSGPVVSGPAVSGPAVSGPAGRAVPGELPAAVPGFAGRAEHLDRLTGLADAGGPVTVVISGTAGVGKSTLAVHWAHLSAHRFPDGQLFVNLRGFGPARAVVSPGEAIRGFLQALEVPAHRVPADVAGQASLYRSLLAGRRMLVLVDNARDAEHVRPLIPGAAGCLVLVTSRRQLTSLVAAEGAVPLVLDLPTVEEARTLLVGRLGVRRVAAEPATVDALITRCARLPLALAIVAARAAIRPSFPLAGLVEELNRAGGHLDALHGGDAVSDVRTVFSWSYRQLSAVAARMFRLLGLHPGPDIGVPAAASLAAAGPPESGSPENGAAGDGAAGDGAAGDGAAGTRAVLEELVDSGLISEAAPGRYVLHDLMRSYAGELAAVTDSPPDRRAALGRVLDHYLHAGHAADGLLAPHREPLPLPAAAAGALLVAPTDHHDAMAWFTTEIAVLLALVRLAAESGFDAHVWRLASSLHTFLDRRGRWHEAVAVHRIALQAAERLGEDVALAHSHYRLGLALAGVNRYEDARYHYEQAYVRYSSRGDAAGAARLQQTIGITYERQGDPARALRHLHLALDLARSAGNTFLQGRFLNGIGWLHAHLGDHAEARTYCGQALMLMEEIGDRDGGADAWDSLGLALHHLGDHAEAVACYRRALALYRDLGHRFYLALTLTHLGETHRAAGRADLARSVWQDALEIFTELDHPDGDQVRRLLAGLQEPVIATAEKPSPS